MPDPFITEQDIVDYLGRGDIADPGVTIAAGSACDMVRAWTDQTISVVTNETVTFDGSGTDALLLPEMPVIQVRSVTVDGEVVTDFTLRADGVLIRTPGDGTASWPEGRQNVIVTYDHGWVAEEIPHEIKQVALSVASRLVVQGPLVQESLGATSAKYAVASTDLTNGERALLRKYRRAC